VKLKLNVLFFILILSLSSCTAKKVDLPEPGELFTAIASAVELPDMVDVSAELLEENTGIEPGEYESAVCYILSVGLSPDEIVIVKAKDKAAAESVRKKLEARLAYKEKSAENYLTEYLPIIKEGVIRRDGLTVSLIVSERVSQIVEVYNGY